MESWKSVVDWEGLYEISSLGNVRKADGTPIAQTIARNGYRYFQARKLGTRKCLKTNVVVARAFLGEIPKHHVCDHRDRNPLNNRADNLRYITQSANMLNSLHWEEASNVSYAKATPRLKNLFRVHFSLGGKRIMFGSYATRKEADNVAKNIRARIVAGEPCESIKFTIRTGRACATPRHLS